MANVRSSLFFDPEDYELLELVNRLLLGKAAVVAGRSPRHQGRGSLRKLFDPYLHPRGIKEMAAPRTLRVAAALVDLLDSLELGQAEDRLRALRAAHAEVMHNDSKTLRLNTARVLLSLVKDLVRSQGDEERQLRLANDFRHAIAGRPRLVRRMLARYQLLEMPEAWNQLSFDHHVHDAHTKGRKSPTHLIMDAWIKGIRELVVVHYNFVRQEAAAELLEAAEIMGIRVRVGVSLTSTFRGKYVKLIWIPWGFFEREHFLRFLELPASVELSERGRAVSEWRQGQVMGILERFNASGRHALGAHLGIEVPTLSAEAFRAFVGVGQASRIHLVEFIHRELLPALEAAALQLRSERQAAKAAAARRALDERLELLDGLVPEELQQRWLDGALSDAMETPSNEDPEVARRDPVELLAELDQLPCQSKVILLPGELSPDELLEILYDGGGRITHLESFSLREWTEGKGEHLEGINHLRRVLNSDSVVAAKKLIHEALERLEGAELPDLADRRAKLQSMLAEITELLGIYKGRRRLESTLGTNSAGRSRRSFGMGLVVLPTLPRRARHEALASERRLLPMRTEAELHIIQHGRVASGAVFAALARVVRRNTRAEWRRGSNTTDYAPLGGNIVALGGAAEDTGNGFVAATKAGANGGLPLRYTRGAIANNAKVLLGFIPAFLTFFLTKQWWLLAYGGALLWFGITGLRNIVQSVVGGGGLFRSKMVRWNDLVSWGRVSDSLLYTGFSVPLLDYLVKTLALDRGFGITTTTNPVLLYTAMALANGLYISTHNSLRGLQTAAIVGNFFRTVLSIPLAVAVNGLLFESLVGAGYGPDLVHGGLQLWAAVISKLCSDVVAGVIEGAADRAQNMELRQRDYAEKLSQVYAVHAQLELLFPAQSAGELLNSPKRLIKALESEPELIRHVMINALDMMYLWMFQPRARKVFVRLLRRATPEERQVLLESQRVLGRKRLISELFVSGLLGKRFEQALAFYLSRRERYSAAMNRLSGHSL